MEYYININNEKRGPYTLQELRQRNITAETLVMAADSNQWQAAWQIEELRNISTTQQLATEPLQTASATEQPIYEGKPMPQEAPAPTPPHKSHHKGLGCLFALLIVTIIAATMVFTCPTEEQHREKLTQLTTNAFNEVVERQVTSDNAIISKGIQMLSSMFMGDIISTVVDNMLTVDNYGVCSLGKIDYDGKTNIVSIGVFGSVFTIHQDQLTDIIEKHYTELTNHATDQLSTTVQQQVVDPIKDQLKQQVVDPLKDALKESIADIIGEIGGLTEDE